IYTRTLNVGKSPRDLVLRVAPSGAAVAVTGDRAKLIERDGFVVLEIPATATPLAVKVLLSDDKDRLKTYAKTSPPAGSLEAFTRGGPGRWREVLKTSAIVGGDSQAFAID